MRLAEVVFNLPLERSFHYLLPPAVSGAVQPGMRVAAPFGPRERIGFITKLADESPVPRHLLRPIRRVLDTAPVIAGERWELAEWMARYYGCSLGEALAVMVPSGLRVRSVPAEAPDASAPSSGGAPQMTPHQRRAFEVIEAALRGSRPHTFLIHGVTGSGKTHLYLEAIARTLQQGRSAVCLLPEIALTPQTIDRFRERFGEGVAVWHSRLTARQRGETWRRLAEGRCRIVIGARSAVFAPVLQPGLFILDEEHESSYKQEDSPRYHTRTVACARARLSGATVLLGSATPSIETYYEAVKAKRLLRLPERVHGRPMPKVDIIDMREEFGARHAGPFSRRLQHAVRQTVERGEQTILLLNRRGFARSAQCKTCGEVERCARCSVPLIYHAASRRLTCHYCNFQLEPEELCRHCKKGYLRFRGAGTERIESELHRLFPTAAIARMDRDTMAHRDSYRRLHDAVKTQAVNVLIGTQMVAKGHDFPQVTLVGVISADTSLNLPDFRAGERTFDLLTQVAGRAGRGDQPGTVVIQTYCPSHYAIEAAREHDYERFYAQELEMRKQLQLPPFAHLIELTVQGASRQRVEETAERLLAHLRRAARGRRISFLGPAPHRIHRLRRTYRSCLIVKGRSVEPMIELLRAALPGRKFHGLPVIVDVDPQ